MEIVVTDEMMARWPAEPQSVACPLLQQVAELKAALEDFCRIDRRFEHCPKLIRQDTMHSILPEKPALFDRQIAQQTITEPNMAICKKIVLDE